MRTVFLKKTQQILACLTLTLLCLGMVTSCKDDDESIPNLALEKDAVQIVAGDNATVGITSGSGVYSVTSASVAIATATIDNGAVKITAVADGTTKLTVTDTKSAQTKTIDVTVSESLALDALETVTITVGHSMDITILSGSGDYSVSVANGAVVSANVSNNILKVSSLAEGTTTVTVTDNKTGKTATVTVISEQIPSIYFAASAAWDFQININAAPEDQPDVWIDLNNDGIKDAGEAVQFFGTDEIYPRSAEMTIYGKVTEVTFGSIDIEQLDVTNNRYLTTLSCFWQKLEAVDLSKNTELRILNIGKNPLASLDLSKNINLEKLTCNDARGTLETLDLSNNAKLKELYCTNTTIKNINFGSINKVEYISAFYNDDLEPFDVSKLTELYYLRLYGNLKFTSFLDLSKNTKLKTLTTGGINLSAATIDLSNNTELEDIYFDRCKLTNVDFLATIPNPEKIKKIQLEVNNLTALDLSRFTGLTEVHCYQNNISGANMTALVASLPARTVEAQGKIVLTNKVGGPPPNPENKYEPEDLAAIKAKFWKPYNGLNIPL